MKRTINFLLLLCLTFCLSACGVPQEDYDALTKENSSLQEQVESLQAEVESLQAEIESLNDESNSSDSTEITSGGFYDSVSAIYSDISITELGNDVSISIFLEHRTELDDSTMFFSVISQILETSELENYYSNATFMMFVDESLVSMLTVLNYESPYSFVSSNPITIKDEYEEYIDTLYSIGFSSNDIANRFDRSLDELAKKYNNK